MNGRLRQGKSSEIPDQAFSPRGSSLSSDGRSRARGPAAPGGGHLDGFGSSGREARLAPATERWRRERGQGGWWCFFSAAVVWRRQNVCSEGWGLGMSAVRDQQLQVRFPTSHGSSLFEFSHFGPDGFTYFHRKAPRHNLTTSPSSATLHILCQKVTPWLCSATAPSPSQEKRHVPYLRHNKASRSRWSQASLPPILHIDKQPSALSTRLVLTKTRQSDGQEKTIATPPSPLTHTQIPFFAPCQSARAG